MYKRRARIRFWHAEEGEKAWRAAELACRLGGEWVEADALVGVGNGAADLWPDLLIAQDCSRRAPPPPPPPPPPPTLPLAPHTRCKCWPRGDGEQDTRQRILGILGGLRLLARLDHSGAPAGQDA
jgi:hypothetical protein